MKGESPTIYVFDDHPSVRRALSRQLKAAGYEVEVHALGAEIRAIKARRPCCFVLDVHLQDLAPPQLADEVASRFPDTPVVYITGHVDEQTRELARRPGVVALLHKPFEEHHLLAAIRKGLSRRLLAGSPP